MEKKKTGPGARIYPMPVVLIGSKGKDSKANFAAIAWAGVVNSEPPMIGVGIRKSRYTHQLITESSVFSVNIPSHEQAVETDYCGIVSGRKVDKTAVCHFTIFYGELKGAPLIEECPVNIECKVEKVIPLPSHDLFIGRVIEIHMDKDKTGGKENIKVEPLVFMGTHYATTSGFFGKPFFIGKKLKS